MAPKIKKARAARPKRTVIRKAKAAHSGRVPASVRRKARAKRPPSSLELKVYDLLNKMGVPYKREKAISRLKVDVFVEPKTVIEIEGCYWHGCTTCFPVPSKSQLKWIIRDAKRHFILRKMGCNVIRIWECEVENEIEKVMGTLASFVTVMR